FLRSLAGGAGWVPPRETGSARIQVPTPGRPAVPTKRAKTTRRGPRCRRGAARRPGRIPRRLPGRPVRAGKTGLHFFSRASPPARSGCGHIAQVAERTPDKGEVGSSNLPVPTLDL